MKRFIYILPLLAGCTTNPTTGARTLLGFIPAGSVDVAKKTWMQMMTDQMAGWQWTAIACIIVGFVIGKLQIFPRSGLGWGLMVMGIGFSVWGLAAPKLVGVLTIAVIGLLVVGLVYVAYCLVTGRKMSAASIT